MAVLTLFCSVVFAKPNALTGVKVMPLPDSRVKIDFQFADTITWPPASFITQKPARLILDFINSENRLDVSLASKKLEIGSLIDYNIVSVKDRVRAIMNLTGSISYNGYVSGNVYSLTLSGKSHELFQPQKELFITNHPVNARYDIKGIDFRGTGKLGGRLIINVSSCQNQQ